MCRKYHIYYPGCGHTADDLLYMCPEATRLGRPCEHPIRLASPRTRETRCPDCCPKPETWPFMALMGKTVLGWMIFNIPLMIWLLILGLFSVVSFVFQLMFGRLQRFEIFLRSALQLLFQLTGALTSRLIFYTKGLAVLTKLIVGTYLWSAFKSLLWWTVAIAMTPFFVILAILEALEDGLWPTMPKLFWKAVDFSTGEAFKFYAGFFLLLAVFVAPASSITKWVETTTKILAPFQVAKLYTWYRGEVWDRLGDFWAVVTLSAVSTSVLTSLFMTAPHASVLSFLNWWVYGIVATLTAVEPALSFLGVLYASIRSDLPQVARYEMVQSGAGQVKQEAVQKRLAWIPQIPLEALKLVKQWVSDISRNQPAPAYEVSSFPTFDVEDRHTSTSPMDQYSGVETIRGPVPRKRTEPVHQESAFSRGREEIRYTGPDCSYWRRGSGERVRPIDGDNAQAGTDDFFGRIEDDCLESDGADD